MTTLFFVEKRKDTPSIIRDERRRILNRRPGVLPYFTHLFRRSPFAMSLMVPFLGLWLLIVPVGCDTNTTTSSPQTGHQDPESISPALQKPSGFPRIVAFGNSLTAGLGVSPTRTYPAVLQRRLDQAGYQFEVINAGVSGETTAGGLRRLDWVLKGKPSIVILELGANDGLRGQSLADAYSNLERIIQRLQAAGVRVVLAGMKIPPNYGDEYTINFSVMYEKLARAYELPLIPFLLEGVATVPELNQADGLHPNAEGYHVVAENVMTVLTPLIRDVTGRGERLGRAENSFSP